MDISVFRAVADELAGTLVGAKLSEIEEDGHGGILLVFRVPGSGRRGLFVNSRPDLPRIHMLSTVPKAVKGLTPSVQAVRNEVAGSVVESVDYEGFERTVSFRLVKKRRGQTVRMSLIYELAGKKPNLVVVDGDGRVELALSYASLTDEGPRPLLAGLNYEPPPRPDKLDPAETTPGDIERMLAADPAAPVDKVIFRGVWGISPLLAREAVSLANDASDAGAIARAIKSVMSKTLDGPYGPRVYDTAKGQVLAAFPLNHMSDAPFKEFESMSEAAEYHYARLDDRKLYLSLRSSMLQDIKKKLGSVNRRVQALESDMSGVGMADEYAHFGNLLMASPHSVPRNADSVTLPDIFLDDQPDIVIPLDPSRDAIRNAERYFKKSRKARQGAEMISRRLAAAIDERDRYEERLSEIEGADTLAELEGLAGGKAGAGKQAAGGRVRTVGLPSFISSDGFEVFYGKNARQNDIITFRFAGPMDLWFHAQGYHGAHVIIRNPERRPDIPLTTILEAASVAAYISKAKKDKAVPVDYTFKKYVRKPRDPVPGQAIFTQNKTVFVDPKPPGGDA